MLKSPLTAWDMTVWGNRLFTEVIKLKQGCVCGSKFSLTGIPVKRGNRTQGRCTQREGTRGSSREDRLRLPQAKECRR